MVHNDRGATAVEYGLIIAFIAAVIVGAVMLLGQLTASNYSSVTGF